MSHRSNLKELIRLDPDTPRHRKCRRRLINAILERRTVAEQSDLLEEIAVACERAYWAQPTQERQQETKRAVACFFRELIGTLIDRNSIDLFLVNYSTLQELIEGGVNQRRALFARGNFSDSELRYAARLWCVMECFSYFGETRERSIQFALLLLEHIGRAMQRHQDTYGDAVWDRRGVERRFADALRVPVQQISAAFDAVERGEPLPLDLAAYPESVREEVRRIGRDPRGSAAAQLFDAFRLILASAASPSHDGTPAKRWLEQLIEAAEHDEAAQDVLTSVIHVLTMMRPDYDFSVFEQRNTSASGTMAIVSTLLAGNGAVEAQQPALVLTEHHTHLLSKIIERAHAEAASRIEQGRVILEQFAARRDCFQARTAQRFDAVLHHARRGLLSGGKDHVDFTIAPLRNIGIRGIAFHPNGQAIDVDVFIRRETPHLIAHRVSVSALLSLPDAMLFNMNHADYDLLREMLHAVVIDSMHRIMVAEGGPSLRTTKRGSTIEQCVVERTHGGTATEEFERRAHFRPLPEGHRVSPEATARAMEQQGWLPKGHTFVQAHYQERKLVYVLPAREIMVYTDDDLFDLGGEG